MKDLKDQEENNPLVPAKSHPFFYLMANFQQVAKPLSPEGKQSEFVSTAEVGWWTNVCWCNGSQASDRSNNNVSYCFGKLL